MAPKTISILSYNIHKGLTATNFKNILPQIKDMLYSLHPDIVFLQEVVGEHEHKKHELTHWEGSVQFEYLADQLWDHFAYGKNAVYQAGHHGNAILSKYPIIEFKNYDLTTNRFEYRGLLHATVENPLTNEVIQLFCTHLDLREKGRKIQLDKISDIVVPLSNTATIVAGDFNDFWKTSISKMESLGFVEAFKKVNGKVSPTFPSKFPLLSLDRVFVKNLNPIRVEVLSDGQWGKLSDHAALFCELELR